MNFEKIDKEILDHISSTDYKTLSREIASNISGRIPHHWMQVLHSICTLYEIRNYMEIGVHNGGSMSYVVNDNLQKKCIGIDLWELGAVHRDNLQKERTKENIENNNKSNSEIILIQGDSTSEEVIDLVDNSITEPIDLLFIDGDHSYEGVKQDFTNYTKYVKSGGFILIDDYHKKYWPGIKKFVDNDIDTNKFQRVGCYNDNEVLFIKT